MRERVKCSEVKRERETKRAEEKRNTQYSHYSSPISTMCFCEYGGGGDGTLLMARIVYALKIFSFFRTIFRSRALFLFPRLFCRFLCTLHIHCRCCCYFILRYTFRKIFPHFINFPHLNSVSLLLLHIQMHIHFGGIVNPHHVYELHTAYLREKKTTRVSCR